jgi:hypothetical protein
MAKEYDHLFKLLIIGDSGKCINIVKNYLLIKTPITIIIYIYVEVIPVEMYFNF